MLPIVLASTSIYRKQLLERLYIDFTVDAPNFAEVALANERPANLALRLAHGKAKSLAEKYTSHIIIGADQVATFDDIRCIGKPGNFDKAKQQLLKSSGKVLTFYTGLCVLNSETMHSEQCIETYQVHFRTLSEHQIDRYLEREKPFQCAGSFMMEGLGISLFEKLEGADPNSLIGLPLIRLVEYLNRQGIEIP